MIQNHPIGDVLDGHKFDWNNRTRYILSQKMENVHLPLIYKALAIDRRVLGYAYCKNKR